MVNYIFLYVIKTEEESKPAIQQEMMNVNPISVEEFFIFEWKMV